MKISIRWSGWFLFGCAFFAGVQGVHADDNVRRAQQALHDQGFYYGKIDGAGGDETTQAVRRFQIRNGLAITGQLSDETMRALQAGGSAPASAPRQGAAAQVPRKPNSSPPPVISGRQDRAPAAAPEATPPPLAPPPIRKEPRPSTPPPPPAPEANYSRPDLRAVPPGEPPPTRGALPPNAVVPSLSLQQFFLDTPFEFAPPPVQSELVRRVQIALRREGLYNGEPDGLPGRTTGAAIAEFQARAGQRRTGRLDGATLRKLRIFSSGDRRGGPQPFLRGDEEDDVDLRRFREYRPRRGGPREVYEGRIVE